MDWRVNGFAFAQRESEAIGHNTNDGENTIIKLDRAVYNVLVPTEVVFPCVEAENRDVIFALLLFARQVSASKQRCAR